mmetsp:Transcript_62349/g.115725  ORF Transcript_62349/g.115725 Transcript_62349/m.115725 type:complete len:257 (-) Transcript_62349:147-917(-)
MSLPPAISKATWMRRRHFLQLRLPLLIKASILVAAVAFFHQRVGVFCSALFSTLVRDVHHVSMRPPPRSWRQLESSSHVGMHAFGASSLPTDIPPGTQSAPPDSDAPRQQSRGKAWTECLLEHQDGQAAEVWVFRQRHNAEFQRLLHLRLTRGYPPGGGDACDRPVNFTQYNVEVGCRDRSIDPDLLCAQCVRVLTGGAYGNGGISVPTYPPKKSILECLESSRVSEVVQGQREDGSPLITRLSETAFCNSVNVAP